MSRATIRARAVVVGAVAIGLLAFPGASRADVGSVSGSAFGGSVDVTISGLGTIAPPPMPAVTLPSSGGNVSGSAGSISIGPGGLFLSTGAANVASQGATGALGSSTSSASVATVDALGGTLTATNVSSTCTAGETGVTASTTITGGTLVQSGTQTVPLDSNPAPNTTFNGTNADTGDTFTVVLNEQVTGSNSITVNAAHIILNGPSATGDIIIGQSHCDVASGTPEKCKPGKGKGDKNHCHSGPPGQDKGASSARDGNG
jgi:hypothetical protein